MAFVHLFSEKDDLTSICDVFLPQTLISARRLSDDIPKRRDVEH
jgi:hypothetical protein